MTTTATTICDAYQPEPEGKSAIAAFKNTSVVVVFPGSSPNIFLILLGYVSNGEVNMQISVTDIRTKDYVINYSGLDDFSKITAAVSFATNTVIVNIVSSSEPNIKYKGFNVGDTYKINYASTCSNGFPSILVALNNPNTMIINESSSSASIFSSTTLSRSMKQKIPITPKTILSKIDDILCNKVEVPIITILGQTTADGSDVGDLIFNIYDQYTYYEKKPIVSNENKCAIIYLEPEQIKNTKFRKCCPLMVSVVKGIGATLREKVLYLYNKDTVLSSTILFDTFYDNILVYGMVKYILSRVLYGKFDINFLLGKYYQKFIKDLGLSRFCGGITFFEDCTQPTNGYQKYFKLK
jgi:hypothetical protein